MRVPAAIVTGFLGSGKTTLLRHVLRHGLDGRRVAVVVNDIADVGVDAHVVSTLENVETMVELDNGCICCSIDFRFEYAVEEIVETVAPELVLIESTGVADPRTLMEKIPKTRLALDAVITMVDAQNIDRALAESIAARGQVSAADFLVINKADLVGAHQLAVVAQRLTALNPRALQMQTQYGRVASALLFGTVNPRNRPHTTDTAPDHLSADGIESFVCMADGELDRQRFQEFLDQLPRPIFRAKGILRFRGDAAPSLFSFTCGRADFHWLPTAPPAGACGRVVFVGQRIAQLQPHIGAALSKSVV